MNVCNKSKSICVLTIAVQLVVCCIALATGRIEYKSTVVEVLTGDTFVVTNKLGRWGVSFPGKAVVVLDGVRAPATNQPGGVEAKVALEEMIKGKEISAIEMTDMGKSCGAWIFIDEKKECVNLMMTERGLVWIVKAKVNSSEGDTIKPFQDKIAQIHKDAKEKKLGIWAAENPIPLWEWVKQSDNHYDGKKIPDK